MIERVEGLVTAVMFQQVETALTKFVKLPVWSEVVPASHCVYLCLSTRDLKICSSHADSLHDSLSHYDFLSLCLSVSLCLSLCLMILSHCVHLYLCLSLCLKIYSRAHSLILSHCVS